MVQARFRANYGVLEIVKIESRLEEIAEIQGGVAFCIG